MRTAHVPSDTSWGISTAGANPLATPLLETYRTNHLLVYAKKEKEIWGIQSFSFRKCPKEIKQKLFDLNILKGLLNISLPGVFKFTRILARHGAKGVRHEGCK